MEKVEAMIDSVKDELAEVKADLMNENSEITDTKTTFDNAKSFSNLKDVPESAKILYNSIQFSTEDFVSADDLAVLFNISRQTILNYTKAGILTGQKRLGDKTLYYNLKDSFLPVYFNVIDSNLRKIYRASEINIICILKDDVEKEKYLEAIKSQYGENDLLTLEKLNEFGVSALGTKPDILDVIKTANASAEEERRSESDLLIKTCQLEGIENTTQRIKLEEKFKNEFAGLLKEAHFSEHGVDVDEHDVAVALTHLAGIKARKTVATLNSTKDSPDKRMTDLNKSYNCTDETLGLSYEKLFKRAYKREVGNQALNTIENVLEKEHIMLNTYSLAGNVAVDMMSIDLIFKSLQTSYRTIIMGYSDLDDNLKAYVDTKIKGVESLGSNYEVTTM